MTARVGLGSYNFMDQLLFTSEGTDRGDAAVGSSGFKDPTGYMCIVILLFLTLGLEVKSS